MIILELSHTDRSDRFVTLERGRHVLGAGLHCDVVLMDPGIQEEHFALTVSDSGTHVELLGEATGTYRTAANDEITLSADGSQEWLRGDILRLGDLVIALRGDEVTIPRMKQVKKAVISPHVARFFSCTVCTFSVAFGATVVGGLIFAAIYTFNPPVSFAMGNPSDIRDSVSAPVQPSLVNSADIVAYLNKNGFDPINLRRSEGQWRGLFYLSDTSERSRLLDLIADMPDHLEPQIFLDSSLLGGVNIILRNTQTKATALSVRNGVLTIGSLTEDDPERERISGILNKDLPYLRDILFSKTESTSLDALQESIVAVWGGERPYVSVKDVGTIRLGEELTKGITLIGVKPGMLLVKVGDKTRELRMNQ